MSTKRAFSRAAFLIAIVMSVGFPADTRAQDDTPEASTSPDAELIDSATEAAKTVEVAPAANDDDIAARVAGILEATEWFEDSGVRVEDGIAFLTGLARDQAAKERAGEIARSTESVVAVVNKMTVRQPDIWDLSPAVEEVRELGRKTIQMLPLLALAAVVLLVGWLASRLTKRLAKPVLSKRVRSPLLKNVLANVLAAPVLLAGIYVAMRISGLTQLAATVVGGTGLIGLVVGIAFRDIAENFLASILISVNRPFAIGDLVEIGEHEGLVQAVTTRGTVLMTLDGNHVQIPNAVVYKATVINRSANPNIRREFVIGLDYEDQIADAQETAMAYLRGSEYVLDDPKPMVLVDELGPSTINVRILYWMNGQTHSVLKVQSKVVRETLAALAEAGYHFPDDNREQIFPDPIAIRLLENAEETPEAKPAPLPKPQPTLECHVGGEEDMSSETVDVQKQADASRQPDAGENLLDASQDEERP